MHARVAANPQRVAVIGPGTEATLFALGLGPRIAAVSDYCTVPEARALPRIGGQFQPNLERLAALQPDLVLVQGQHPALEQWCRSAGVDFHAFPTDSLPSWRQEVQWLGDKFGLIDESRAMILATDAELAAIASHGSQAPPRVLLVVSRRAEEASGILAAGLPSFLSELLTVAGGRNVVPAGGRAYVDLNEETLVRLDPEVILEFWPEGAPQPAPLEVWRRSFPRLAAARDGRVAVIGDPDALIPGPRMPAIARAMAAALR